MVLLFKRHYLVTLSIFKKNLFYETPFIYPLYSLFRKPDAIMCEY